MRDMTVGLVLFGFFTLFGFIIGVFGGYLMWAEESELSYDVYRWTEEKGGAYVKSFSDFHDALDYVNTHDLFRDGLDSIVHSIIVCDDWCRTVYP